MTTRVNELRDIKDEIAIKLKEPLIKLIRI